MPVSSAGVPSLVISGAIVLLHLYIHLDVLANAFYSTPWLYKRNACVSIFNFCVFLIVNYFLKS